MNLPPAIIMIMYFSITPLCGDELLVDNNSYVV